MVVNKLSVRSRLYFNIILLLVCGIELMSTSKLLDVDCSTVQQNLAYWPVDDHSFIEKLRHLL